MLKILLLEPVSYTHLRAHETPEHLGKKFPHEISAGEQQRVAFARALITNPEILMLDEPFGALDKRLKSELHTETKRIFREKELSVLLVTHDEDEAEYFGDKTI